MRLFLPPILICSDFGKSEHKGNVEATMRRRIIVRAVIFFVLTAAAALASSRRGACINNLRMIDNAKDQYALEYGGTYGMLYSWENLSINVKDMSNRIYCPSAMACDRSVTNYDIRPLGTNPVCLVGGRA